MSKLIKLTKLLNLDVLAYLKQSDLRRSLCFVRYKDTNCLLLTNK